MQECYYFADINMNTVRGDDLGFEHALLFDVWHNGHALFFSHGFDFKRGFRNMNMQRHIEFFCNVGAGSQDLWRSGVRRVRRNRRDNEGMAFPFLDEFTRHRQRILVGCRVWSGVFHDGLSADRAHARISCGLGNRIFEKIHIVECSHAAADLFGAGQQCAKPHEFR